MKRPRVRFIPTPVGNTIRVAARRKQGSVHPHARGEHGIRDRGFRVGDGSSPRPWGTLLHAAVQKRRIRFIPTPVGNTSLSATRRSMRSVHPHARGEHICARLKISPRTGSSPRPWGTHHGNRNSESVRRFIPTPVGNTIPSPPSPAPGSVHPHARGEHCGGARLRPDFCGSSPRPWGTRRPHFSIPLMSGSSPRPWGTPSNFGHASPSRRFIPTPVGNTVNADLILSPPPVHPHARGEHATKGALASGTSGSSPRPWGTHKRITRHQGSKRFIPTPVGNTRTERQGVCPLAVHPHARGEHWPARASRAQRSGSSPRPWGTLVTATPQDTMERFIPTPVGNT